MTIQVTDIKEYIIIAQQTQVDTFHLLPKKLQVSKHHTSLLSKLYTSIIKTCRGVRVHFTCLVCASWYGNVTFLVEDCKTQALLLPLRTAHFCS